MSGENMRDERFADGDIDGMDLSDLESLAVDINKNINDMGALLTGFYWDLGLFLLGLKQRYGKHGTWEKRLARMNIARTRATKAMKIKETFSCRKDCAQMSVEKRRPTSPWRRRPVNRSTSAADVGGTLNYRICPQWSLRPANENRETAVQN